MQPTFRRGVVDGVKRTLFWGVLRGWILFLCLPDKVYAQAMRVSFFWCVEGLGIPLNGCLGDGSDGVPVTRHRISSLTPSVGSLLPSLTNLPAPPHRSQPGPLTAREEAFVLNTLTHEMKYTGI